MKRGKKLLVCMIFVSLVTGMVFAQGGGESDGKDLPKIGTTIYKFDDNYMSFVRKAYEAAGVGKAEILLADSMNDQSKQNDQIDTYINKGVEALAVNLVDPAAAGTIIEKARKADLPVIFFNKEPATNEIMSYDRCWYVGITSAEFGIQQGEMVAEYWNTVSGADRNNDGVLQYVMLKGEPGHRDAELRTTEPIRVLKEKGIDVEELELQTGMWDSAKGKDLMETWLAKHGDAIECVFANNDAMALGAVEALKAAGYFSGDRYMPVVGVDGLPEAIDLIKKGQMLGTVLNNPKALGKATFDLAYNVAQGKDPLEGTKWTFGEIKDVRVAAEIITEDNLDKAIEAYK